MQKRYLWKTIKWSITCCCLLTKYWLQFTFFVSCFKFKLQENYNFPGSEIKIVIMKTFLRLFMFVFSLICSIKDFSSLKYFKYIQNIIGTWTLPPPLNFCLYIAIVCCPNNWSQVRHYKAVAACKAEQKGSRLCQLKYVEMDIRKLRKNACIIV